MNLKEIQIYGFKSFSDRVSLKFDHSITGIVGPNGCGKSNVVDAVKWVLGEQSARGLRGKSMQDLIFSGTEQRKSMSYCEVSLILDNKNRIFPLDLDEIVVSRKLYRDNESEYLLNKNTVRLKDITDLLRDAGLGKEGYSIVGQGRMDAILNAKPEDRRAIFEEALGVSKFRVKKAETERKLIKTRDNIVRLYDILNELTRQLTPLKKQAADAQKYLAFQEELRYHEINNYIFTYDNASENKAKLKSRITQLTKELLDASERYQVAFSQYEKVFSEMSDIDTVIKNLRNQQLDLSVIIERYAGETRLLNEKVHNVVRSTQDLTKEIGELSILLDNTTKSIESNTELEQGLRSEELAQKKILEDLRQDCLTHMQNLNSMQEELEKYRKEVIEAMNSLSIQKSQSASYNSQKSSITARISTVEKECVELDDKWTQLCDRQSKELDELLCSDFEKQTTKQMAMRIHDYTQKVCDLLERMTLEQGTVSRLTSLVTTIKQNADDLTVTEKKAENWQQNIILMSALSERMAKFSALQENLSSQKNKLLSEKDSLKERLRSLENTIAICHNEEERLTAIRTAAEEKVKKNIAVYDEAKIEKDKAQDEMTSCKLKLAGISSNISACQSKINSAKQSVARTNFEITQKKRQIETNERHLSELHEQISTTAGTENESTQLMIVNEKLANADRLKQDLQTQFAQADSQRNYCQAQVQALSDNKIKEEFALERIDDDIATIRSRIEQQYGLTYSSAMQYKDEQYDITKSKEAISKLHLQINKLGYVNVNAVADYTEVQGRHDDISMQMDDLKRAEQDLTKTLKDLTREMTVRFNNGFEKINQNFGMVFRELFAGGYARMSIEKDEAKEDLDFGIEIEAQPPGKKLRNISLLSGGERTLTAAAILFAILKLRPMPFCMLDEIEAALDDANAERISGYIRRFSTDTQFIVVTHKKPTMESCDVLYGVTMEEKGVSKLVSVQLVDALEDMVS